MTATAPIRAHTPTQRYNGMYWQGANTSCMLPDEMQGGSVSSLLGTAKLECTVK